MAIDAERAWGETEAAAEAVRSLGEALGFPYVAVQGNLADPEPMRDRAGRPFAETHYEWVDPDNHYWLNRRLALQSPFLHAARLIAEPFYFVDGGFGSWRPTALLDGIDVRDITARTGIATAVIAPVHQPRAIVGAIVWAARDRLPIEALFAEHAVALAAAALRLIAAHAEASARPARHARPVELTRREVQCLRWAAAGKTDSEIGIILDLSVSTVRFHLRNAGAKLETTGRAQAVQVASSLGFVSPAMA